MNIVFLAPQFSENHYLFCDALRKHGINVLCIGDTAYEELQPELAQALDEYYKVDDIRDYAQIFRAIAYFTYHYGKIDRLESLNYYLLDLQAKLRTDFNIPGIDESNVEEFCSSLAQKKLFRKARANVLHSILADTPENGQSFAAEVGYPVLAKADNTALNEKSYFLTNDQELADFFERKADTLYALEEVAEGTLYSYEGLTDLTGQIVFETVHQRSGQNSTLLPEQNPYLYSLLEVPADIEKVGRHILSQIDVKGSFFSVQFLRTARKKLIALHIKLCPDSKFSPDIFNYANDFDIYAQWANAISGQPVNLAAQEKYHCTFIGRRIDCNYAHSHEEVLANYGHLLLQQKPIDPALTSQLGNYSYIFRCTNLNTILSLIDFAHQE